MAAVYKLKLCRAILVGFRRQAQRDRSCKHGCIGILEAKLEADSMPTYRRRDTEGEILNVQIENSLVHRDDVAGQLLGPELIHGGSSEDWQAADHGQVG